MLNYDAPRSLETYLHRVGRTARAGSEGLAVSIFTDDDRCASVRVAGWRMVASAFEGRRTKCGCVCTSVFFKRHVLSLKSKLRSAATYGTEHTRDYLKIQVPCLCKGAAWQAFSPNCLRLSLCCVQVGAEVCCEAGQGATQAETRATTGKTCGDFGSTSCSPDELSLSSAVAPFNQPINVTPVAMRLKTHKPAIH